MVDFTLSPSESAIVAAAASFSSAVLSTAPAVYLPHTTQAARFASLQPLYRGAVQAGLIKGLVPSAAGGAGGSLLEAAMMVEEMYSVETSFALTIFGTGLGLWPLLGSPDENLKKKFLKPFLSGEGAPLASLVHSEPGGTANWLKTGGKGLQTVAWRESGEWVVSGEKMWASNSSGWDDRGADLQCLVCREVKDPASIKQDPLSNPADAIMILLVTRDVIAANDPDAYSVLSQPELAGHTATSGPHVRFHNLRVPATNVLAEPGKGVALVSQAFFSSAALVGAMSVGIMRATFDAALKFAKEDTRGGERPIMESQSVSNLLMDIKMRTDASRLLTWQACTALEAGKGPELALEAKIFCSDSAVKSVVDAMSAVGVSSYNTNSPFPRLMNDALCMPLFDGGNIGIRRRQLENLMLDKEYEPWNSTFG